MHFTLFTSLALSALAAPPPTPSVAVDPLPVEFQFCMVQNNNRGLNGQGFLGTPFKPVDNQPLIKGTIKDVTFTLKSKYTPSTPAGQFAVNNFVLELQKGTSIDTLEAYTNPSDPTEVLLSSKTTNNGVGGGSLARSKGPGTFNQNMLGLNIGWSVEQTAKGQITKFSVDKQVDVTLNQLTGSFEPQIKITHKESALISEGACTK